ncbi:MAG: invasion associated locus B family protein [Pseudomonadota bacterium]
MTQGRAVLKRAGSAVRVVAIAAAVAAAGLAAGTATAQDAKKKDAPKAAAKDAAAKPAAGDASKQNAWLKVCDTLPVTVKDKDGKDVKDELVSCMTRLDLVDGPSGLPIGAVSLNEVEGKTSKNKKTGLMALVPLGTVVPAGVRIVFLSEADWKKVKDKEKIEDGALKPMQLNFSVCHAVGCNAEIEATDEMMGQLKGAGAVVVNAIDAASGKRIVLPFPLAGFKEANAGKGITTEEYQKQRKEAVEEFRKRQAALAEQYKKDQAVKQSESAKVLLGDGASAKPADAGAAAAKPATPAPAEKKK